MSESARVRGHNSEASVLYWVFSLLKVRDTFTLKGKTQLTLCSMTTTEGTRGVTERQMSVS